MLNDRNTPVGTNGRSTVRRAVRRVASLLGSTCAVAAIGVAGIPAPASAAPQRARQSASCASLAKLNLPNVVVRAVEEVPAGDFATQPLTSGVGDRSQVLQNLPAFCRVWASLRPTANSDINVEVWMPRDGWNGKFMGVGNGGWRGFVSFPAMGAMLTRGYAVASTDTGHLGSAGDASFALGHPEKLVDFGHRAVHLMTVNAKKFTSAYYDKPIAYSYWNGCSSGGKQGLKEAQVYPDDYDGIIAGSPANWWTHLLGWEVYLSQAVHRDLGNLITTDKYALIHRAVVARCDEIDGLKDGLIDDPRKCTFKAADLNLECNGVSANCLTAKQLALLDVAYSPMRDSAGKVLFPRLQPGSEMGFETLLGTGGNLFETPRSHFQYVVHEDPKWDFRTFDVDKDIALAVEKDRTGGQLNAMDSDLSRFKAHGGKVLMYMGWSDHYIAPELSVLYHDEVEKKFGAATDDFFRLFMVPGMAHCGGGDGPDQFDKVTALENWVERGIAPERLIAWNRGPESLGVAGISRTRPLCAYPAVARYRGTGSINDAANFTCKIPSPEIAANQ